MSKISSAMSSIASLAVSSIALNCGSQMISGLSALPPGYLPFEKFVQQFSLGGTSTEQIHEKTKTLSQTMQADVVKGLEMLLEADQAVLVD